MTGTVANAISRQLIPLTADMPIGRAIATMLDNEISGAPVVDDSGHLAGIITAKDCFRAALHGAYHGSWDGSVADFMTVEVETMEAGTDLVTAASRFLEVNYRRFPVLRDGHLLGIVTRVDVLRALFSTATQAAGPTGKGG